MTINKKAHSITVRAFYYKRMLGLIFEILKSINNVQINTIKTCPKNLVEIKILILVDDALPFLVAIVYFIIAGPIWIFPSYPKLFVNLKNLSLYELLQMDSFTQILLGIATAELCAGEKLQRKTFLYGALLGTIPDLDIVVGQFMNPVEAVSIHRGLSHSLLFFLGLSPMVGGLISKIEKQKIEFRSATNMVFWCLLTHVLLDMFTSWGTQIFWPLPHRIALKTIFVIDPLYTLPLLIALIVAWRKPTFGLRKKYILRGVYISSAYLVLTSGLKLFALSQFEKALQQQNIAYTDLIVKPTAFNCILWNANVATKEAYLLGDYSLFDSQPITFTTYQKNNELATQLSGNADFETLKQVSEGWYIITQKDSTFYFNDLRFGLLSNNPSEPNFAFSYIFKNQNGSLKAYEVPKEKRDGKALMKGILQRIKGN